MYFPLLRGEKRFSEVCKQVDYQVVSHIVSAPANNVLVHVPDLASDIFGKGVAHTRKEPVLIESSPGNPIGIVKAEKRLALNNVTKTRGK